MADFKPEYKPYKPYTPEKDTSKVTETPKVVINERPKLRPFIVSDKAEEAIDKVVSDRATRLEVKRQAVAPKPVSSVPKVTQEGPAMSDQTLAEMETGRRMLSRNRS